MQENQKETEFYIGKGNIGMQDDYMDFINYVFGFNGTSKDFYQLLPKLYKKSRDPAANSYVVTEDGKLKAAIGAFPHELEVMGERILCKGIGNVAVHPFSRSKGYMKATMQMALDDMVKEGTDLSILGGRRARYNYFAFERAGTCYHVTLNSDAMRHHLGKERKSRFRFCKVAEEDAGILDEIARLSDAQPFRPIRPREQLYDILVSWKATPYAAYEGERFVGYLLYLDGSVSEALVWESGDYFPMLTGFYDVLGRSDLTVSIPGFHPEFLEAFYTFSESYAVYTSKMFLVLNYEKVTRAFLRLKATYAPLPDGELTLLIHGFAGDELLRISVQDGLPDVRRIPPESGKPDRELSHLEAISFLFAPADPARLSLPPFARLWFPAPLYLYAADAD